MKAQAPSDLNRIAFPPGIGDAMVCEPGRGSIHVTRVVRPPTPQEFGHYLAYMTEVLALAQTFAIVVDASIDGPALSSANLRAIASWVSTHRVALRQRCVGYALIRESIPTPVRFATAMMLSIIPMIPMPYRMFGDRESAFRWVDKLVAGRPAAQDLHSKVWSEPPPE